MHEKRKLFSVTIVSSGSGLEDTSYPSAISAIEGGWNAAGWKPYPWSVMLITGFVAVSSSYYPDPNPVMVLAVHLDAVHVLGAVEGHRERLVRSALVNARVWSLNPNGLVLSSEAWVSTLQDTPIAGSDRSSTPSEVSVFAFSGSSDWEPPLSQGWGSVNVTLNVTVAPAWANTSSLAR